MSTHAHATFELKNWDEKTWDGKPYTDVSGAKCTRASVTCTYQGDIEGESTREYLMYYREDGTGTVVGLERIVGSVGGRAGSFMLQHSGTFKGHEMQGTFFVVHGSGTDDLRGLQGEGSMDLAEQQSPFPLMLEYNFE